MSADFGCGGIRRFREHVIDGQQQLEIAAARFLEQSAGEVELVIFHERLPYRLALRFQKGVRHRAADEHGVGKLHQILHDFDFVGNFRAAQHGYKRPLGIRDGFAQIGELLFHQQAGRGLPHKFRDAHHRGMRAMRRAKRVANEQLIAQSSELLREFRVVGFFLADGSARFREAARRHS